jgi:hypothetical protein
MILTEGGLKDARPSQRLSSQPYNAGHLVCLLRSRIPSPAVLARSHDPGIAVATSVSLVRPYRATCRLNLGGHRVPNGKVVKGLTPCRIERDRRSNGGKRTLASSWLRWSSATD